MAPFTRSCGQYTSGQNYSKGDSGRTPSSKRQEVPPWFRTPKPSCTEAFSQDSNMVREARIFQQMAMSASLLGTSIHEIEASWDGPEELKQVNYAL